MPQSWDSVASNPDYLALSPDQQQAAKDQYFNSVVAPNVPAEHLDMAKQQFNSYKPQSTYSTDSIRTAYQATMNNVAKPINNVVNSVTGAALNAASSAIPQSVKTGTDNLAESASNAIDSTDAGQWIGDKLLGAKNAVSDVGSDIKDLESYNPDLQKDLSAFGQNAQLAGNIAPIAGATKLATSGAKAALETSPSDFLRTTSSVPGEITPAKPPSIRSLSDITAANNALAKNTNTLYKKADDLDFALTPEGGQAISAHVANATEDATGGLDKQNHPGVIAALKTLQSKADSDGGLTLSGVDKVRQTLGRIAQNSNPDKANEVYAANKARAAIDDFLGIAQNDSTLATGSPDAIDALNAARKAHALEMQHSDLRTIVRNANGNGNKIQSAFQKIYNNEDDFNRLHPENQPIIQSVAQPGRAMNAAQAIGNMGFGAGGNKYALGSEAIAALVNPASASVIGPTVIAGTASNVIRNRLIRKGADTALKNIEAASEPAYPLYGEPKVSWLPETKALPAPEILPALPAPERPYVTDISSGQFRHMTDDELAIYNMSPADQAKRVQKVPQGMKPDELQQIRNAYSSLKDWNAQYQSLLAEGKTHLEAIRELGKPPEVPPMPQDWGTGYGDIIRRMRSMSDWDNAAKALQDAGHTPKEVINKLGKRPEAPTFKSGGAVQPTEAHPIIGKKYTVKIPHMKQCEAIFKGITTEKNPRFKLALVSGKKLMPIASKTKILEISNVK